VDISYFCLFFCFEGCNLCREVEKSMISSKGLFMVLAYFGHPWCFCYSRFGCIMVFWGNVSIKGLHTKLWAPIVLQESQLWEFQDSHLGVPGQNDIWVLVPWPGTDYIVKGKGVASLKSGPWWVLWVRVCSWWVRASKCYNYALTNLLFGLCRLCE
jgi:hypothetical protein